VDGLEGPGRPRGSTKKNRSALPVHERFLRPTADSQWEDSVVEMSAYETARAVNLRVYQLSAVFTESSGEEGPVDFLCECGCMSFVPLPASRYDADGGAWLEGHRIVTPLRKAS
jgi:hypothetical protein